MATYDFSYEFQHALLRVMAHDPMFLMGTRKAVAHTYFNDPALALIAESMLDIFDKTHGTPSLGNVVESIEEFAEADDDVEETQDLAREVFTDGLPPDSALIRERALDFGVKSRMQEVLLEGADYLDSGRYNEYNEAVREAITVQADAESAVYDYYDMLQARLAGATSRATEAIPTGIHALDKHLPDGGVARGEMALFMGLPGYGKTTTLINVGVGALAAGKKVFHATVGDMSEGKVGNRYDSCITGRTIFDNRTNPIETVRMVGDWLSGCADPSTDRLKIKFWPSGRITVPELERHLRWLEASQGWKPDVLIVDYAANMAPRKKYEGNMIRLAHEEIYKELRALGAVLGCVVWSAIQANRGAFGLDVPGMGEAAEAFGPMRDTDIAIGIGMKPEERDAGFIKFRGAKIRDSEAEWVEVTGIDFKIHRIYERDDFGDEDGDDFDD